MTDYQRYDFVRVHQIGVGYVTHVYVKREPIRKLLSFAKFDEALLDDEFHVGEIHDIGNKDGFSYSFYLKDREQFSLPCLMSTNFTSLVTLVDSTMWVLNPLIDHAAKEKFEREEEERRQNTLKPPVLVENQEQLQVLVSKIRNVTAEKLAAEIIGVQPMDGALNAFQSLLWQTTKSRSEVESDPELKATLDPILSEMYLYFTRVGWTPYSMR